MERLMNSGAWMTKRRAALFVGLGAWLLVLSARGQSVTDDGLAAEEPWFRGVEAPAGMPGMPGMEGEVALPRSGETTQAWASGSAGFDVPDAYGAGGAQASAVVVDDDWVPVPESPPAWDAAAAAMPPDGRGRTLPDPAAPAAAGQLDFSDNMPELETSPGGGSLGDVEVDVEATTGVTWDDNIFLSSENPVEDTILSASVLARLQAGNFNDAYSSRAAIAYSPQGFVFLEHSDENSIDHDASGEIQHTWSRLTAGASAAYRKTSGGNPDFGERVDARVGEVEMLMAYALTGRTRAEVSGRYEDRRYDSEGSFDSTEADGRIYVDYEASDKTHLAVGASKGQVDVDGGDSQEFHRALARVRGQLTSKTRLEAEGGADFRQTGAGDRTTPVFELAIRTAPATGTEAGLRLSREIEPSGSLGDQNYVRTGVSLTGSQRLTERFKFTLDAGFDHYGYEETRLGSRADREDDDFFVRPGIRYEREHVNGSLFYEYRKNSGSSDYAYEVNRVGLTLGTEF